jgi:hypothetical protein
MSTIHNINGDLAAATAALKPADMVPVWIAADGVSKKVSGWQLTGEKYTAAGSTLTLTAAAHGGATIKLDTLAGSTVTLPAATGSGVRFKFLVTVLATSNNHIVKVANSSDTMIGMAFGTRVDSGNAVLGFAAGATADTITLNRTTTGSVSLGEWIKVVDEAANVWSVRAFLTATGAAFATPFSATV